MARNQKLQVDIEANDRASGKIDKVADRADQLDKSDPEIDIGANDKASATLDELANKLDELGIPVGNLSSKLGVKGGVAGGVAAIGAGLVIAAQNAADVAIEAENLATLTGDSVDEASRLNAVWKQSGADPKDLQDVLLQMNGVLSENADLAETLGVNLADGATVGERFEEVARALDKIPDAAKRSQIASQVFGEEGVRQYNAMRNSVGDLSDALRDVPEGSVISDEEVEAARKMQEQMRELTAEFQAFAQSLGSVALPAMGAVMTAFNDMFDDAERAGQSIRGWFDGGEAQRNREFADSTDQAVDAVERFDTSLLDGAKTAEEAKKIIDEYAASTDTANAQLDVGAVLLSHWTGAQREAEEATRTAEEAARTAAEQQRLYADQQAATEGFIRDTNTAMADQIARYEETVEAADTFLVGTQEAFEKAQSSINTFSEEAIADVDLFQQELANNVQAQIDWQTNLNTIEAETSPEFAAFMEGLGKDAAGLVSELATNGDELDETFGIWADSAKIMHDDVKAEFDALPPEVKAVLERMGVDIESVLGDIASGVSSDASPIGANLISGITAGVDAGISGLVDRARSAIRQAVEGARQQAGIRSPSKVFAEEVGEPIAEGIAEGISTGTPSVTSAVRTAVTPSTSLRTFGMVDQHSGPLDLSDDTLRRMSQQLMAAAGVVANGAIARNDAQLLSEIRGGVR